MDPSKNSIRAQKSHKKLQRQFSWACRVAVWGFQMLGGGSPLYFYVNDIPNIKNFGAPKRSDIKTSGVRVSVWEGGLIWREIIYVLFVLAISREKKHISYIYLSLVVTRKYVKKGPESPDPLICRSVCESKAADDRMAREPNRNQKSELSETVFSWNRTQNRNRFSGTGTETPLSPQTFPPPTCTSGQPCTPPSIFSASGAPPTSFPPPPNQKA